MDILKQIYRRGMTVQDLSQYQDFLDAKRTDEDEKAKKRKRDREKAKRAVDGADEFTSALEPVPAPGN